MNNRTIQKGDEIEIAYDQEIPLLEMIKRRTLKYSDQIKKKVRVKEIVEHNGVYGTFVLFVLQELDGTHFRTVTKGDLKQLMIDADPRAFMTDLKEINL